MRRIIFIYARTDSRRLPRKALIRLGEKKLIDIIIDRAQRVECEDYVLLTSNRKVDDELADHVTNRGFQVVRGHASDLVSRSLQAIDETESTHFLRVNGDSPFFSPELASYAMQVIEKADLVSNLFKRCFPYGVAIEWISSTTYKALAETALPEEREHVTLHLYRQISCLNALSLEQERDDSHFRLVLDTGEDYCKLQSLVQVDGSFEFPYWQVFGLSEPTLFLYRHAKLSERNC